MRNLIRIIFEGALTNLKRILFASDRVTDLEMRDKILNGNVEPTQKVAENSCIGCGGCSNVCPTGAVEMIDIETPVTLMEGLEKTQIPRLNSLKCINCYYCHDFCPIYALFGEAATIHPNDVGLAETDIKDLMGKPFKISEDKVAFISQFLSDKTIIKNKNSKKIGEGD